MMNENEIIAQLLRTLAGEIESGKAKITSVGTDTEVDDVAFRAFGVIRPTYQSYTFHITQEAKK